MKRTLLLLTVALATHSIMATDATPKALVEAATRKLADQPSYAWKSTTAVPSGANQPAMRPGPTEGKTEKGGYTYIVMAREEGTVEAVLKNGKGAVKAPEGWKSLFEELQDKDQGTSPLRLVSMMLLDYQLPATQILDLAEKTKELTLTNGAYAGALTDSGARQLLSFRRAGPGGGGGPEVKDGKGFVRFWLKDGLLSKCEFSLQGTLSFGGEDRSIDRTTTVEIKDVGAVKIVVPAEAAKKLAQ